MASKHIQDEQIRLDTLEVFYLRQHILHYTLSCKSLNIVTEYWNVFWGDALQDDESVSVIVMPLGVR